MLWLDRWRRHALGLLDLQNHQPCKVLLSSTQAVLLCLIPKAQDCLYILFSFLLFLYFPFLLWHLFLVLRPLVNAKFLFQFANQPYEAMVYSTC